MFMACTINYEIRILYAVIIFEGPLHHTRTRYSRNAVARGLETPVLADKNEMYASYMIHNIYTHCSQQGQGVTLVFCVIFFFYFFFSKKIVYAHYVASKPCTSTFRGLFLRIAILFFTTRLAFILYCVWAIDVCSSVT